MCIVLFWASYCQQIRYFSEVLTWIYPKTTKKDTNTRKEKNTSQKYSQNMLSQLFFTTPLHPCSCEHHLTGYHHEQKNNTFSDKASSFSPFYYDIVKLKHIWMLLWHFICSEIAAFVYSCSTPFVSLNQNHRRHPLSVGLILLPHWQCIKYMLPSTCWWTIK